MHVTDGHLKGHHFAFFKSDILPIVESIVSTAGYVHHDWSVTVFGCHKYGSTPRPVRNFLRIGNIKPSTRQIEFSLRPTHGQHHYEIRLSVPRSLDFGRVEADIAGSVNRYSLPPAEPATSRPATPPAEQAAPAPVVPVAAAPKATGLERLESLRSRIDVALNVMKDAKAIEELRLDAQAKNDAAADAARPLLSALNQAEHLQDQHESRQKQLQNDLREATARVMELEKTLTEVTVDLAKAKEATERARTAAEGPSNAWDEAQAALAEAVRLEAERAKAISEMPGIASIFSALESLGK